ncbi:MAG: cytidine deaminase [Bacteroidetes bacterium]|nr:cytidine deaminase [Bacteroidota bacterium]
MVKKELNVSYQVWATATELPKEDLELLEEARKATVKAYAPYSHFRVGAAALLANGKIISGANQENASFPAGTCAERVVLAAASAMYNSTSILTLAISYESDQRKSDSPVAPCGICRQALLEFSTQFNQPIRLLLAGMEGMVYEIGDAATLLPFSFKATDL